MVKYWSPIDPHAHLRGIEYVEPFAQWAFDDAREVGLRAILEQPNTTPPLTTKEVIEKRKADMDKIRGDIFHGIHIAITPIPSQRQVAYDLIEGDDRRIVAGKTFYVRSTASGSIEILNPDDQRESWNERAKKGCKGPYIGHFEDGPMFESQPKFDYTRPETHSLHQCPEAEVSMFERQFRFAYDAGYEGDFVVLHTSNPDTIDLGDELVRTLKPRFKVHYEATWHHMLLNVEQDYPIHGNGVKMNPPLRPREMQERLFNYVLNGRVHIIGTDHAPHPKNDKGLIGMPEVEKPKSGVPAIPIWTKGIEILRLKGIGEKLLLDITFGNSNKLYKLGLEPRLVDKQYNPKLWEKYGYNPFSRVDGTI